MSDLFQPSSVELGVLRYLAACLGTECRTVALVDWARLRGWRRGDVGVALSRLERARCVDRFRFPSYDLIILLDEGRTVLRAAA